MKNRGKSILIIDDDKEIRSQIRHELENAGFQILEATNGTKAKDIFLTHDPCFVISEVVLEDSTGFDLCNWIRSNQKSEIPIIFVSRVTNEDDRIIGLRIGADDYITKPFNPIELLARVENVLRRTAHRCNKITYRGLTLKPLKGEVKYQGTPIPLTLHEFKLLYFLIRHPNQTLSRLQILEELYPNENKIVSERTVDVHILKLREKFKSHFGEDELIGTVRGVGYRFIAF